jgi:peptidyl-prolyl cis-trans isomerase C
MIGPPFETKGFFMVFARMVRSCAAALLMLAAAPAAAPAAAEDDPVVARVDGIDIHLSEVRTAHDALPEQYRQIPIEQMFDPLVDNLVGTKLLAREARRQNLHEMDDVKRALQRVEEQVLEGAALRAHLDDVITEEAVRARYDKMVADETSRMEIRARHILVETEETADALIEKLDGGADFAALARDESTGPSASNGGDLGFFNRSAMVEPFAEAAFAMADGEHSAEPVQTQFGWHVIKVEERRTAPAPAFEQAAPSIQEGMVREAGRAYMDDLRKAADIERFTIDGAPRDDG